MAQRAGQTRLALDVNFPEPILETLSDFMVDVELVPLRRIDPALSDLEDRALMVALHQEGLDWLVTNNYKMLRNPSELAAIMKAQMKVFAIEGVGADPLRATGALLLDLPGAIRSSTPGRSQVFWSRPRNPNPQKPWDLFSKAAERRHQEAGEMYEQVKVSDTELTTPWRELV